MSENIIIRNISWLLLGCVLFSPLIVNISIQLLGFPFMVPEVFFIPLFLFYRKDILPYFNCTAFGVAMVCLLMLLAISFLVQEFSVVSILNTFRGYVYLFVSFSFFYNRKMENSKWLLFLSVGALAGWCAVSLYHYFFKTYDVQDAMTVTGNMMALIFAISMPFMMKNGKLLLPVFALIIIIAVFAGMRRIIVIALVTYGLTLLLILLKEKNLQTVIKYSCMCFAAGVFIIFIYPQVETFLQDNSPVLYRRLILKSESALENANSSDIARFDKFSSFTTVIKDDIYPKGFVSKRSVDNNHYIDASVYEPFYTLGLPLAVVLFVSLLYRLMRHIRNYIANDVSESGLCAVWIILMIVLLFIEGQFLNYPFVTPLTGYALARVYSNENCLVKYSV